MYIKEIESDYLISAKALQKFFGIPPRNIRIIKYRWRQEKKTGKYIEDNKETWFYYSLLPSTTYKKVNIDKLLKLQGKEDSKQTHYELTQRVQQVLKTEAPKQQKYYQEKYGKLKPSKAAEAGRRHVACNELLNIKNETGIAIKELHSIWNQLPVSRIKNYKTFCKMFSICVSGDVEAAIFDKKWLGNAKPTTPAILKLIALKLYEDKATNTPQKIYNRLLTACDDIGVTISQSTVDNWYKEFELNPVSVSKRYGADEARRRGAFLQLRRPEKPFVQVQWDAVTIPFCSQGFQRYSLDRIVDTYSRKTIAFAIRKTENTELKLETFTTMLREYNSLPIQINLDPHSATKTKELQHLMAETKNMGVRWEIINEATANQTVEGTNQHLNAIWSDFDGYIGSIKAKRITAKHKDDQKHYQNPNNWKTEDEIYALAEYAVRLSNDMPQDCLNGKSPNEVYALSEEHGGIPINETDFARILCPENMNYKVRNGCIEIRKKKFVVPVDVQYEYAGQQVNVRYVDIEDGLYLFDIKSGEPLGFAYPQQAVANALSERTERDNEIVNKHIADKRKKTNKGKAKREQVLKDALKEHPEAIEIVNHYALPKDIRQIAEQDAALKKYLSGMPIRKQKLPIQADEAIASVKKDNPSPFLPKKHTPGMFDINSFLSEDEE